MLVVTPAVIAGLALSAPQAGVGAGVGSQEKSTSISISSSVPAFHGQVKSGSKSCEGERHVELYRKRAGRASNFLGGDVSGGSGHWQVSVGNLRSGAYYAKAKQTARCAGARSELALID